MAKPLIVTNLRYIGTGKAEITKLSGLTKYFQYRDGSVRRDAFARSTPEERQAREGYPQEMSDYVKPEHRDIRWVDRGMGETHSQITRNSVALAGKRTTARLWVIAPDPELMGHIPEEQRMEVLRRTTEQTLSYWYDDNGWGQPEYSYVLHDKERNQDNKQMLHTHVVTPGTYDPGDGLGRLDQIVQKPHIKNLHEISGEVFQGEMERVLGRERTAQIIHERDERNLDKKYPDRQQRQDKKETAERRSKMQQVHDVMSIMKREQERKRRKQEGRKKSREEEDRERAEDMRMYTHYHQHRERQARQQSHADRQAEWERKRQLWQEEQLDDLHYARLQTQTQQLRAEQERRKTERQAQREAQRQVLTRMWGWEQADFALQYLSPTELEDVIDDHKEPPEIDL